jgi:hypothetical protein
MFFKKKKNCSSNYFVPPKWSKKWGGPGRQGGFWRVAINNSGVETWKCKIIYSAILCIFPSRGQLNFCFSYFVSYGSIEKKKYKQYNIYTHLGLIALASYKNNDERVNVEMWPCSYFNKKVCVARWHH